MDAWVALGVVAKPHGVRGAVRLQLYNAESETLCAGLTVRLGEATHEVVALEGQAHAPIVKLSGVTDRDQAEALRGVELLVPRAALPEPEDDEIYVNDLLGCTVHVGGEDLGILEDVIETPAHVVYVVRGPAGERMLPESGVKLAEVDLAARRIVMELPEGWTELWSTEPERRSR